MNLVGIKNSISRNLKNFHIATVRRKDLLTFSKRFGSALHFSWTMADIFVREFSMRATTCIAVATGEVMPQILLQIYSFYWR